MTTGETTSKSERLAALNRRMAEHSLAGYWQPRQPTPQLVPCLWPWSIVHSCLMEAGELVELGGGEADFRRVVQLINPSLVSQKYTSRTLQVSVQLVQPGEAAECHRHSAGALRFVIEGDGRAFTNVEGEPMLMEPGDLILTPSWTWHSHENPGVSPVIWLDVLDAPLSGYLDVSARENYPGGATQPITLEDGYCRRHLGPVRSAPTQAEGQALPYSYKWRDTVEALEQAAIEAGNGGGTSLEFRDPLSGGPTMPTIGCHVLRLAPHQATRPRRHTGSTLYHVVQGNGSTTVGSQEDDVQRFAWGRRDSLFIPPNAWYHHSNSSSTEPAILFSVTDRPVLEKLRLDREELR
jgi:gentisate 1,2-dioxygenase